MPTDLRSAVQSNRRNRMKEFPCATACVMIVADSIDFACANEN
jgi:hypothetical protein